MRVRDLCFRDVEIVVADDDARTAAAIMKNAGVGMLPVVDETGHVEGVITDRDLALRVLADEMPVTTRVGDLMTKGAVTVQLDDEIERAEACMKEHHVSRVVVVDDHGRLAGIVSLADLPGADSPARALEVLSAVSDR